MKHKILLESGSLLIMRGAIQHHWLHQIAKTKKNTLNISVLNWAPVYQMSAKGGSLFLFKPRESFCVRR